MARLRLPLNNQGFTLLEVLLALCIIAIALTALLTSISQNVVNTNRIKEKSIQHWVAMQGVSMIQLGLLPIQLTQELTEVTQMFGQRWYWRASVKETGIYRMEQITISVSSEPDGPFNHQLIAYRYIPE